MSNNYAIFLAAEKNDVKTLKRMIEVEGVDPNIQDYDRKATPLHWASNKGHVEAIEYLIDQGADVNMQNKRGRTALHNLVELKFDKIVLWLIKYCGADPYIEDNRGLRPYDLALNWFKTEIDEAYQNRIQTEIESDSESESESIEDTIQSPSKNESSNSSDESIFKIFLPNSTYKSVRVNITDTAEKLCEMLAEKLGYPYSYSKYLVLYERIKDKDRKVQKGENILEVARKWPLIFGKQGNETRKHCYFIALPTTTSPEDFRKALIS